MTLFDIALALGGVAAGATASVAGFGIGSVLTPLLGARVGTRLAVAAVSIPHVLGTAVRFWLLRGHVHRRSAAARRGSLERCRALSVGLVGNQGGIRSAALLAFDLDKTAFVATATAVGLIVDAARMPVYIVAEGDDLLRIAPLITLSVVAVVTGTLIGSRTLGRIRDGQFRTMVAVLLFALGTWMLFHG